jgi:hypothetical protein
MNKLMKIDRYEWDELMAGLSDRQRGLLEASALETGLPATGWTAIPGLTLQATVWATVAVAKEIQRARPDWSWGRCLDEAEPRLLTDQVGDSFATRPKSVRSVLARWRHRVRGG